MKSLLDLVVCLITEASAKANVNDVHYDISYITRRVKHEGVSFLKLTLPEYAKCLLLCIERNDASHFSAITAIKKSRPKADKQYGLPVLFQGFLRLVFDEDGKVRDDASAEAIYAIRQIGLVCSKIKDECTNRQRYCAERKFCEVDNELQNLTDKILQHSEERIRNVSVQQVADVLWTSVLSDWSDHIDTLRFNHGPGAVFDSKIKGSYKFTCKSYNPELDALWPFADTMFANYNHWVSYIRESIGQLSARGSNALSVIDTTLPPSLSELRRDELKYNLNLSEGEDLVRVVFVPKTCKGPRTIAVEPVHQQFIQQGIKNYLYLTLERNVLTSGSICFLDQTVSQNRAHKGSVDGSLATIDLSDASDRVHARLVDSIFRRHPQFLRAINACRTKFALLPSGRIQTLNKFASMGSALCFPVEAMVFFTICMAAILRDRGIKPSYSSIKAHKDLITVYGDDIIVPTEHVGTVVDLLQKLGLKVNVNKSFSASRFRESCGKEYFAGTDITPVYLRVDVFDGKVTKDNSCEQLSSYYAFRNQLYQNGWWKTVQALDGAFKERVIFPNLSIRRYDPIVPEASAVLGRRSFLGHEVNGWTDDLQRSSVNGYALKTVRRATIDGWDRLLRNLMLMERRSAVPGLPSTSDSLDSDIVKGKLRLCYKRNY